ncbi:MAG: HAD-IA family hydrolase, partial [Eubacteriales bacterium]|nr:HAD-IA family hydrolase [Eubacteriales bacterium]
MKKTNATNFKVVMFDIDACLIDSAPNLILTLDRAVFDTGGGHHDESYLRQMLGLPGYALNDMFTLPDWQLTLRKWSDYYAPLAVENKPFEGIATLLAAIKNAGLPLGVATSQGRALYLEHFHKYGLAHYFDLAVCADDVANPKPAADPLLFAAEHFGVSLSEILFLGDAPYDMQCAKAAGA